METLIFELHCQNEGRPVVRASNRFLVTVSGDSDHLFVPRLLDAAELAIRKVIDADSHPSGGQSSQD